MDLMTTLEVAKLQGLDLNEQTIVQLEQFRDLLYEKNAISNFTRIPILEADVKHFADSLLIAEFCGRGSKVLDIGPGPGFPSWVLAACRQDLFVTAVESQGKMSRMMQEIPLTNLVILNHRAEECITREFFEVVTGRAVAPFAAQFEISAAWVAMDGLFIPFRTPAERDEIEGFPAGHFGFKLQTIHERALPGTDIVRLFPQFVKVKATSLEYPRQWGRIKTRPIR